MKIAFVAQPIDVMTPPIRGGSVGLWMEHVAERLHERGHQATIIGNGPYRFRRAVIEHERVRYVLTPTLLDRQLSKFGRRVGSLRSNATPRNHNYVYANWNHAAYGMLAAQAAAREKADVIHVMNYSQLLPRIRRKNPEATIALHMHCEWLTQFPREIVATRLPFADLIIGCSEHVTSLIVDRFPEYAAKCVTVPNAADIVAPSSTIDKSQLVLFVGRISPEKGLHDLIVAFRMVLEKFPHASLRLIGASGAMPLEFLVGVSDDPQVTALRRFYELPRRSATTDSYLGTLEELAGPELGHRIIFEGYRNHTIINESYHRAAVVVNPSLSESFGITLVEAMMMKIPVIATQVGGMRNTVLPGETGLLVPPAEPEALADAIGTLLANPGLAAKLGEAGRNRAMKYYSWEVATERLINAYAMAQDSKTRASPKQTSRMQ